jgi:hypothetical protein
MNPINRVEQLIGFRLRYFFSTVIATKANVVPAMDLARLRLDCQRGRNEKIVRAMHTAFRRGFFILLNCHVMSSKI